MVGLAALVVSICAVAVSIYEASLERQHARAEAWPHVELTIGVSSQSTRIAVENSGLGPAAIEAIAVRYDGQPVEGWSRLLPLLFGRQPDSYQISGIEGRVLRAGSELVILEVPAQYVPQDIMARLPRTSVTVCYRSVFEEYWQLVIPKLVGASSWNAVNGCGEAAAKPTSF